MKPDPFGVPEVAADRRSRLARWVFNLVPTYAATGAKVTFLAADWSEVRVRLPLTWRTRNGFGTTFGGALFAAADPLHVVLLVRRLGPGYIVWDRTATIRFLKPGRTTLYARVHLPDREIAAIRAELADPAARPLHRIYTVDWIDRDGVVYATVEKTLYLKRKPDR